MLKIGWEKADATLIDQRFVKRDHFQNAQGGQGTAYQVWEYLVELPGSDGRPVRLSFKEKTYNIRHTENGSIVPVLVNKKRTKAAFDLKDPRINSEASTKARERAEKEAADARFEANKRELL